MPDIKIRITNLPQIRRAFSIAPFTMSKNLNIAIARATLMVKADSQRNTPVRTGRLRASTYTNVGNLKGEVGTNTRYDVFVHEGTRYMRSRPYLRRAVEGNEMNINELFRKAVQDTLDDIGIKI